LAAALARLAGDSELRAAMGLAGRERAMALYDEDLVVARSLDLFGCERQSLYPGAMTDLAPVRRALISVSDKTGLVAFARALAANGVEILSTGGSASVLREAGVGVKEVSEHSGFPEILDGRVKTLVPQIHGGILGRRDVAEHVAQMAEHGIA